MTTSKSSKTRRATPTEHQIQSTVFDWRDTAVATLPVLALLHAVPNGAKLPFRKKTLPSGKVIRICPEAKALKREGMTPGILDTHLPVARGPYIGLWIEHKAGRNKMTDDQVRIAALLRAEGNLVMESRDPSDSIAIITDYLKLGPFRA